ncbi:MAG: DUF1365 domain-containing protein [Granulosicoccus sp.]
MTIRSCLYAGQVFHRRTRPREHQLRYSVYSLLLDLSEIDDLAERLWLFSRNRFNLFGFYDRDFGENQGEPLSDYIAGLLTRSGIHTTPTRILLSCYPRVLGYVFNPLSLFYCLDEQGECFAVVHEVHNTFGERHAYALAVDVQTEQRVGVDEEIDEHEGKGANGNPDSIRWINQQTKKQLFVSPFASMGMHYKFRLNIPAEKQIVVIRAFDDNGLLITASYTAKRQLLNASGLARFFFSIPFLSAKVVLGIHWEALRLWVKRVPLFKHQPKRPT